MVDKSLSKEKIEEQINQLDGWNFDGDKKIEKEYTFKNFKKALDFTNQVGEIAEDKQHHPDIYLTWGKVNVSLTSHEEGSLTAADFEMAQLIEERNK